MYRITAYVLPVVYILLFLGMYRLLKAGKLPVFDYSFFIMVSIFWAVYFLAKRNLFDPLVAAMERRRTFIAGHEDAFAQAERGLLEARRTFDLTLKRVREEERTVLEALRKELALDRERTLAGLKADLQRDLDIRREALIAESESLRTSLEPEILRMTRAVVSKVLRRDVA
jgi:F0F1-type ATP synthase membrane subunit b/b'